MNKRAVYYTEEQENEILAFINKEWGEDGAGLLAHEIQSEYVHTDVAVRENTENECMAFVTFGMGAKEIDSPLPEYRRTELIAYASLAMKYASDDKQRRKQLVACSELVRLSKYPFANSCWFGPGHTINASDVFKEAFGYQYFIFAEYCETAELSRIGNVCFLVAIPIYEDERAWIVEHRDGSSRFLRAYLDSFEPEDNDIFAIDIPRKHIIPVEVE